MGATARSQPPSAVLPQMGEGRVSTVLRNAVLGRLQLHPLRAGQPGRPSRPLAEEQAQIFRKVPIPSGVEDLEHLPN